jgi:uncharacterized protein (TIGR01777 family)
VEDDPASDDFLGQTCLQWEQSIEPVQQLGKRLVKLRLGIALAKEGGALKEFIKPLRLGVAAILGKGTQMVSWVHIDDICRAFTYAIEQQSMSGAYNLTAPKPVDNRTLTLTLAKRHNGKAYVPFRVPSGLLKIVLGEMSVEVLKSATVSSEKITGTGFDFRFPDIEKAIHDLIV